MGYTVFKSASLPPLVWQSPISVVNKVGERALSRLEHSEVPKARGNLREVPFLLVAPSSDEHLDTNMSVLTTVDIG